MRLTLSAASWAPPYKQTAICQDCSCRGGLNRRQLPILQCCMRQPSHVTKSTGSAVIALFPCSTIDILSPACHYYMVAKGCQVCKCRTHLDVVSCRLDIALGVLASGLGLSCSVVSGVLAAQCITVCECASTAEALRERNAKAYGVCPLPTVLWRLTRHGGARDYCLQQHCCRHARTARQGAADAPLSNEVLCLLSGRACCGLH